MCGICAALFLPSSPLAHIKTQAARRLETDEDEGGGENFEGQADRCRRKVQGLISVCYRGNCCLFYSARREYIGNCLALPTSSSNSQHDTVSHNNYRTKTCLSLCQIARARRKTETAKDLDGIDLSNVLAGSRRRRGLDDENFSPPKKKRLVQGQDGVSHSECSGNESGNEDDSEEEFQLSG